VADEEKPIKVSDFRMFTPDGELKPEYRDLDDASSGPADAAGESAAQALVEDRAPAPAGSAPAEGARDTGDAEPDFIDLVRSLATSAYAALGLLGEAGTPAARDLPGARRMIEWLALIERKTRNNLTFAEQDLLTRALYELRMAYVEASGVAAAPPTR
jgi:hypothetical protein